MKTGWKFLVVAGVILLLVGSQVMAQPGWGRGRGRNQPQRQGMGRRPQGPGLMGPGSQQRGAGPWRPLGAGAGGPGGAWCPLGPGQGGMPGLFGRRLNLTPEQTEKIRDIVEESRSRTLAEIKKVLTAEQVQQLEQMQQRAGQFRQGMAAPGRGIRGGRMGGRGQGWGGRGRRNWGPQMGPGRQVPPAPPAADAPAVRGRRPGAQRTRPDRPGALMDLMFERADANNDGVLTPEELQTLRQGNRGAPGAPNE